MSGFVDLQVNGYAGVDFNSPDDLTEPQMIDVCRRLQADGVEHILATVITAPLPEMTARISRIADWIDRAPETAAVIAGIHVEGPFLNRRDGFVGAHPPQAIRVATEEDAQRLLDAGRGHVRMLTLAPEQDAGGKVTRQLVDQGILVAGGHSDATLNQLREGIDSGLRLFTHLGNGCPAKLPRHDNIIQRVLSLSDALAVSFIADGHHVPIFALANYLQRVPNENVVIVTDAISAAGLGPGRYELSDQVVEVDEDGAAWAACRTHYAGCATTMPEMARILSDQLGVDEQQLAAWMSDNPRRLMTNPCS